jgi:hypothetical protein
MRKYAVERAEWERETGNKPVELGMSSVDAMEARARDGNRWRTSATAPVEVAEPRSAGPVVVNLVAQSGVELGGFWLLNLISGNKYVVFSPDYVEFQSRGRGQWVPTTPS